MSDSRSSRDRRVTAAIQQLDGLRRAGVRQLPKPRRAPPSLEEESNRPSKTTARQTAAVTPRREVVGRGPTLFDAPPKADDSLPIIAEEVSACQRCDELASTRTQTVFGVGNPHARLCFLGEAPGADEDRQGEPFVGRAGQLLTKIIEACTLKRSDVYILNVLKCRPPGNRNPLPQEVANCRGYLDRQLAVIKPEFICCLGAVAAQTLLETDKTIGRMRGKILDYRGIGVVCTYHPAYLLRNPAAKKDCWADMKLLLGEMGIELG